MPLPTIAPQHYCASCEDHVDADPDGTCPNCSSIVDLVRWQNTEEAWRADARAMEAEEMAPRVIVWDFTR